MLVSYLMVRALVAEFERRGLAPDSLLPNSSWWRAESAIVGGSMQGRDVDRLVQRALELTGDPALGLSFGQQAPETMLHVLGHLLLACGTMREAFDALQRYSGLLSSGIDWYLVERDDQAAFGFTCPSMSGDLGRFSADWVLALALRVGRHYASERVGNPTLVRFVHPVPSYASAYANVFPCPVLFGQMTNELVFDRVVLDVRQAHADPMLFKVLADAASALQYQATGTSFSDRVRNALRYEHDLVNIDFELLASRWGMTRRTLRRRLQEEGRSLSELHDEACCQQAKEELRRHDESIKEIAERLGYSETSAFHRAFKRWTGQTPSAYRTSLGTH